MCHLLLNGRGMRRLQTNASAGCDDVLRVCTYCRMAEHLDTATNPHTLNNAVRVGWMRPVVITIPGNTGLDALMWRILFRAHLSISI